MFIADPREEKAAAYSRNFRGFTDIVASGLSKYYMLRDED